MSWLTHASGRVEVPVPALGVHPGRSPLGDLPKLPATVDRVDGLNFANAIRAHQVWKKRLGDVLDGHVHADFDIEHVRRDDECSLGRWLRSSASHDHRSRAVFRELFGTHAALHHAAAEVLHLHAKGQTRQARVMMERGLFARNSVCVQGLLAQLFVSADAPLQPVLLTDVHPVD